MIKPAFKKIGHFPGKLLVKFLTRTNNEYVRFSVHDKKTLSQVIEPGDVLLVEGNHCLLYTSPSPRDLSTSRMPSSA